MALRLDTSWPEPQVSSQDAFWKAEQTVAGHPSSVGIAVVNQKWGEGYKRNDAKETFSLWKEEGVSMKRSPTILFCTLILLGAGLLCDILQSPAAGIDSHTQRDFHWYNAPADFQNKIIGTWMLLSAEGTNPDGSKFQPFGPSPVGRVVFDSNGHFMLLNMTSTLPKFASNNRANGTPDENKAIVTGSFGLFGTYSINEAEKTLIWRIEVCTFPNWIGQEQKQPIELVTDEELKFLNPAISIGGGSHRLTWKRVN